MKPLEHEDLQLSKRIIEFLKREHTGRENSLPHKAIREHFCVPDDGQDNHAFRRLYENKVASGPDGIFYVRTPAEALWWKGWLARTYHSAALAESKYNALVLSRPELRAAVASEQKNLFEEGAA